MSSAASAGSQGGTKWLVYFFGALGGLLFGYDTGEVLKFEGVPLPINHAQ